MAWVVGAIIKLETNGKGESRLMKNQANAIAHP